MSAYISSITYLSLQKLLDLIVKRGTLFYYITYISAKLFLINIYILYD